MKYRLFSALALGLLLLPGLMAFSGCSSTPPCGLPAEGQASAAIIDQLFPSKPDPGFVNRLSEALKENGYRVDYFSGEQVTVDLYRRLPERGYRLIVFRAHAGLMGNGARADQKTCLFTNQPFRRTGELSDQLLDRVVKAAVDDGPPFFGIGADFVNHAMRGKFGGTTVIMMGCSSFEKADLAQAFLARGAAGYFGWDAGVNLAYVQDATLKLLECFLRGTPPDSSVRAVMQEKGPDPQSGARLACLPASADYGLQYSPKPGEVKQLPSSIISIPSD